MYQSEAKLYKGMGDPIRLTLLRLLWVREACVCELVPLLPISQSAVSQHLGKLKEAGLVRERRHKQWVYYSLRTDLPKYVREAIESLSALPLEDQWQANTSNITCELAPPLRPNRR